MNIRVNGFRFRIPVSPDCFINSPRALKVFSEIFDKISASEDDDPEVWTYGEHIADVFLPEFERLAPPVLHTGKLTLANLAVRGSFVCEYRVVQENAIAGVVTESVFEDMPLPEEWDMRLRQSSFPVFDPADVEVPYSDGRFIYDIIPRQVFVQGKTFFYKSCWSPYDAIDEVEKYSRIHASGLSTQQLSTSRLFGIVAGRDGQTKGLLYDWIETKGTGTLTSVINADTPPSLREKWASQIHGAVMGLHSLGIVWSDVKPDNVLIDGGNNAVVIDLEGGTTRGWVDHDTGGSVEGDLQGLERLVDFIFNDQSPLRLGHRSDEEYSDRFSQDDFPLA
ncbi:hypothetical protein HIM_02292 [Hirsutella minnesotensis 3608]|nr:hypothetical protein HIM_02292 [Hirsutella minnesotensis 3608]